MRAKDGGTLLDKFLATSVRSDKDSRMADTCYEAELPLLMAAWNCDNEMIDMLVDKFNASIESKNTKGDNVFHSLIRVSEISIMVMSSRFKTAVVVGLTDVE